MIKEEIQNIFAANYDGLTPINGLSEENPAYAYIHNGVFGVGFNYDSENPIYAEAMNVVFRVERVLTGAGTINLLLLQCFDAQYSDSFATMCAEFVAPMNRQQILANPYHWWDNWTEMLGNKTTKNAPYAVFAELWMLNKLQENGAAPIWAADHEGSHDIESNESDYEVKSTIKKQDLSVKISSQFQLQHDRPLNLAFIRVENSAAGQTINDLVRELVGNGYDSDTLESELMRRSLMRGDRKRDMTYSVLEARKYVIDENFPQITPNSFVNGEIPLNISHISYTVDLSGLEFESIL